MPPSIPPGISVAMCIHSKTLRTRLLKAADQCQLANYTSCLSAGGVIQFFFFFFPFRSVKMLSPLLHWKMFVVAAEDLLQLLTKDSKIIRHNSQMNPSAKTPLAFSISFRLCTLGCFIRIPAFTPTHMKGFVLFFYESHASGVF